MDSNSTFEQLPEPQIVKDVAGTSALVREHHVLSFERLENLMRRFSPSERLLLYIFSIALAISTIVLIVQVDNVISVEIPTRGGDFVEGETGPARFINPILAISQADQDLSALIYSGLMRALPDGTYVPDLAENYSVSADGTTYTFKLRPNATFHDGTPVNASDVLYTIATAQNPDIKSPHRADWEGVVATSPDDKTVVFKLPHAYAPFIENTTLGILPKHLWSTVQSDSYPFNPLNTHPVGSGPYRVAHLRTDPTGAPTRYDLEPFDNFTLGASYISRISFSFYQNEEALTKAFSAGQVDAVAGVSPSQLEAFKRPDVSAIITPLPRVFGVFFNQNKNAALAEASVRQALEEALDKKAIIKEVLQGYGEVLDGPIPPGIIGHPAQVKVKSASSLPTSRASTTASVDSSTARTTLKNAGWSISSSTGAWTKKKDMLALKLATADEPELVATANMVAEQWRAAGVQVDVQVYPLSDFNNTVLRPRNYDAIIFGEVVSRSGDLFAFWHSSQRNDPGLNLSLYANSKADSLLTQARAESNKEIRDNLYEQFATIVRKDRPAIFLYSPDFIYIVPTRIRDIKVGALSGAWERYLSTYQWYTDTERVWNFFSQKINN